MTDHLFLLLAVLGGALFLARFFRRLVEVPDTEENLQREAKQRGLAAAQEYLDAG